MYLKVHNLTVCMSGTYWKESEHPWILVSRRSQNQSPTDMEGILYFCKNMTPFSITRMAFSITTEENFAANMLNEGFPGGSVVKNLFANAEDTGDAGSIPVWRRSLGEGNENPLQDSCLENLTDRGKSMRSQREGRGWACAHTQTICWMKSLKARMTFGTSCHFFHHFWNIKALLYQAECYEALSNRCSHPTQTFQHPQSCPRCSFPLSGLS